jgi:hypothetical protein
MSDPDEREVRDPLLVDGDPREHGRERIVDESSGLSILTERESCAARGRLGLGLHGRRSGWCRLRVLCERRRRRDSEQRRRDRDGHPPPHESPPAPRASRELSEHGANDGETKERD